MTDTELRQAFDQHKDAVYRFAWRMTASPDAAEDIAQEVFLALVRKPDAYDRRRGPLRAFLLGAARNQARKRFRDEQRWDDLGERDFEVAPVDLGSYEVGEAVAAAVRALPPLQREVLILAEYEDLSLEELARAVEAEIGAVKARLHRARENLRKVLRPYYETNPRTVGNGR